MQVNSISSSKSLCFAVSCLWCLMESDRTGGEEEDTEFWHRPLRPLEIRKWNLRILFYLTIAASYLPSSCLMNKILIDSLQLVSQIWCWSASQKTILRAPHLSNVSKYLILAVIHRTANQNCGDSWAACHHVRWSEWKSAMACQIK
jgi:hypothetical protein